MIFSLLILNKGSEWPQRKTACLNIKDLQDFQRWRDRQATCSAAICRKAFHGSPTSKLPGLKLSSTSKHCYKSQHNRKLHVPMCDYQTTTRLRSRDQQSQRKPVTQPAECLSKDDVPWEMVTSSPSNPRCVRGTLLVLNVISSATS